MENQDKLHQQFKDAAGKAEEKDFARMEAVWNRVEEKLDNKKQRRIAAWWKYTGMAAMFLLFMGVGIFMLNNENNPAITPKVTPENNVTVIDTQRVKETFDPAKAAEKEVLVTTEKQAPVYKEDKAVGDKASDTNAVTINDPEQDNNTLSKGLASPTGDMSGAGHNDKAARERVEPISYPKSIIAEMVQPTVSTTTGEKFSGVITDSQGIPVPGVNVMVAGTRTGVSTDFDGKYMIDAKEGEKLVASFIGLQTQTVTLGKQKDNVNLQLKDDSNTLQEVVVEAYRTTTRATSNVAVTTVTSRTIEGKSPRAERRRAKKAEKEGATASPTPQAYAAMAPAQNRQYRSGDRPSSNAEVTTITSKTTEEKPNANFIQTLQGQVPGLNISTGSGQPGAANTIVLRGMGSINGTIEPLYVIDGVLLNADTLRNINSNDIESISVIKGTEATSIYGNRGKNGVVIIKTKNGLTKKEKRKLERERKKLEKEKAKQQPFTRIMDTEPIEVNQEDYESFVENQFENPATTPLSTFSIDVDNASYTNIRRFINNGQPVPKDAVRVEEMINFFKYQYPQPQNNEPFSINTEYSDAPWNPQHKLLKIGLQGKILSLIHI